MRADGPGGDSLAAVGIGGGTAVHWNLAAAPLYEHALRRGEGVLSATGALSVETGRHTGRSPRDKFVVREPAAADVWWGEVNRPLAPDAFAALHRRLAGHLAGRELFVQDLYACADPAHRLRVRVASESAWSALFARNLLIVPTADERDADRGRSPDVTVLHAPGFAADPAAEGTRSETAIVTSLGLGLVLVAGTGYAGEIKKSIFGILQYLLPREGVATMHCSANVGAGDDTALFFGLSGTGKTTLSTDPTRTLVGDDEHGWDDRGVFNFEGGSYAKAIHLSPEAEPDIHRAVLRFGTVLENVVLDPDTRELRLDDDSLTENTRAAFPLAFIKNATTAGLAGHPRHVVFLTADASGVLPPVARLDPAQALYWYLSGYTSKLAGTERGVTEPEPTFSPCFGGPFLLLPPSRYAALLGERLRQNGPACWLVNTGWSGGPYGVGARIAIGHTRAIVRAIVGGTMSDVPAPAEPVFGLRVPNACPGVPPGILRPRSTWGDSEAYDAAAGRLARAFADNFRRFAAGAPEAVAAAGPS
jgi:phosphoenolpyruvate carboxykinase (ATP)